MKYVRILGLSAVIAAALMAFAGTASADLVTSPAGTTYTGTLKAEAEGHTVIDNPIAKIECASTFEGKVESHGAGVEASGKTANLTFTGCTNSWHVTVTVFGAFGVVWSSNFVGVFAMVGVIIEVTRFGVTCRYSAGSGTKVGTLTGGTPATLDISASLPFHSGSPLCGEGTTAWTGSYKLTTPTSLFVDNS
jgi:hypothetical protein